MNTFDQIKDLCEKMNDNIKNNNIPFTNSQSVIIFGVDANTNKTFQFACGSIINIIASIGCLIDIMSNQNPMISREDIIRILLEYGGDDE